METRPSAPVPPAAPAFPVSVKGVAVQDGRVLLLENERNEWIATPENEAGLAEISGPMTGNQLERFARAHRQASPANDAAARVRRRLAWRFEEDGSLAGTFRLPPLQGAVLLKALRAACGDLEHPHGDETDVSAETSAAGQPAAQTSSSLADALLDIAEAFLAGKVAGADDSEVYQVVVHVGTDALNGGSDEDVSAETPDAAARAPDDPADPARCHVEDGPAISVSTAQMLGCTAALSWMRHDRGGAVLALGRRRRRPNAAMRRAARERDRCRCRFPGCESRRVDLHHIQHWSPDGTIEDCHEADIAEDTIIPPWYGERLDLDHAIYICLANARAEQERREQRDQAGEPGARDDLQVFEPEGWADRIRRYYDEQSTRPRGPVLVPIPV